MGYRNLKQCVDDLERTGQLIRIEQEIDPYLEAAEIQRRVYAAGGPAIYFARVKGCRFPMVSNLFGTIERTRFLFRDTLESVRRLVELKVDPMAFARRPFRYASAPATALRMRPKRVRRGAVLKNQTSIDQLPHVQIWPDDAGAFILLPQVYSENADRPGLMNSNLGMYRMQVHDARTTGMHWQIGKGGGFHYDIAEQRGAALPVTVFLGGPPALILSAVAPLPENVPELMLASLIAGERLGLIDGVGPHPLVSGSEFALIGSVSPGVRRPEGPFGDHYGYYSLCHDYPVFSVRQVAHRRDAIFPATVVGKPRQEDFFIGDLLQELLSPLFPLVMPAVEQLWSYGETGYHSLSAAVVKQRYKREAMASAFRILGEGQLSLTKFLLMTDQPVDLKDFRATLEHVLARTRPETDLYVFSNLSMDTLDYTGPAVNLGSKGVWLGLGDPVRELPGEFSAAELPQGIRDVQVFCRGCLVVGAPSSSSDPEAPLRVAAHPAFEGWPLVVVTDEPVRAVKSSMNFLWTTFTRFEPAADIYAASTQVARNHLVRTPPIVIDARRAPSFPAELTCRPDTAATVSERWQEYFPAGGVEMGDSERGHLD